MAIKSEMAKARATTRKAQSEARRILKHKMNPYDRLSSKRRSLPSDYEYNGEKTIHDIIFELESVLTTEKQRVNRKTFVDKMVADITSPEVKEYWRQRIANGGIKF